MGLVVDVFGWIGVIVTAGLVLFVVVASMASIGTREKKWP